MREKVYCYYDDVVNCVEGTVIPNGAELEGYTRVHWDAGGESYFSNDRVFYSKEEWDKYNEMLQKQIKKEEQEQEYRLYLKLKAKHEHEV